MKIHLKICFKILSLFHSMGVGEAGLGCLLSQATFEMLSFLRLLCVCALCLYLSGNLAKGKVKAKMNQGKGVR